MDWEIGNYAFGAAAGHPFIHAIIKNFLKGGERAGVGTSNDETIPRIFHVEYYVPNTTGPGLVSRRLAEYPDAALQVKVLFPKNLCDSINWHRLGAFGVHLMGSTWRRRKGILRRRLTSLWESRTRKKLLKESVGLGESRSLEFKRKA